MSTVGYRFASLAAEYAFDFDIHEMYASEDRACLTLSESKTSVFRASITFSKWLDRVLVIDADEEEFTFREEDLYEAIIAFRDAVQRG